MVIFLSGVIRLRSSLEMLPKVIDCNPAYGLLKPGLMMMFLQFEEPDERFA